MTRPDSDREASTATHPEKLEVIRYRWRVRDCLLCPWRVLGDSYSEAEMWQLLVRGRFAQALRITAA